MGSQNLDQDGNCVNSGSKHPNFVSFDRLEASVAAAPGSRQEITKTRKKRRIVCFLHDEDRNQGIGANIDAIERAFEP
jgi:hypothetical protein